MKPFKRASMARVAIAFASLAVLGVLALPGAASAGPPPASTPGVIYDNIPFPQPGNLSSLSYEATATSEFGGAVTFGGLARTRPVITVLMSSWGCQTGSWTGDNCSTAPGSTFSEPITLTIRNAGASSAEGSAPGSVIDSVTQTFNIPLRPSKDDVQCTGAQLGEWYDAAAASCFNGLATPITFDLSNTSVFLPQTAVVSVAYNTSDYGAHPYGDSTACHSTSGGCGYDSLNVALTAPPVVGSDPLPNDAYLNSSQASQYCSASNPGVGSLVLDTGCWTGYQPAIEIATPVTTVLTANPSLVEIGPGLGLFLKLSAHLSTAGGPLAGEPIVFSALGGNVCTAITDANGNAACAGPLTGVLQSVLGLGYHASFAGDGLMSSANANGPLAILLGLAL